MSEIIESSSGPIEGYYVYMIYNESSIAQIGHGSGDRMNRCVRGTIAKKHNKAFICALTEVIKSCLNKYCYVRLPSKIEAEKFEKQVHSDLGIKTNKDGATLIDGISSTDILGIHKEMWEMVKLTKIYRELEPNEKMMAEELFELVAYATTKIKRSSGKTVSSTQGDNLEGNILVNIQKEYLIHIYQKLTNNYHRYGKHKLRDEVYFALLENYHYEPNQKPFQIIS